MKEVFEKLLRKVVVPQFQELEDVFVDKVGFYYRVQYYQSSTLISDEKRNIYNQTESIFNLLGVDDMDGWFVTYGYSPKRSK